MHRPRGEAHVTDAVQPGAAAVAMDESQLVAQLAAAVLDDDSLRERAAEEESRADDQWRQLHEQQRLRNEAAEEEARLAARAKLPIRSRENGLHASTSADGEQQQQRRIRADDEPDASGWTPREQRDLEAALRANPASSFANKTERWQAISAMVPGHSARQCVQRYRQLGAAVRAHMPPRLLRLEYDVMLSVLGNLRGLELCALACVCKELCAAAHDDALWLPIAEALPAKWVYSKRDRDGEPPWEYTLRTRYGLYGAWVKLHNHRRGLCPYLCELGRVESGTFIPNGRLDYRVSYGAICELVQLQAARDGWVSHDTYKTVAEQLVALSTDARSGVPGDLHMTVREIYKTCYPGFGAGTGSGAYAPGLQAGGSSTKASTSGSMLGKGVQTMTKKVQDEDMRKRLETRHTFMNLITH